MGGKKNCLTIDLIFWSYTLPFKDELRLDKCLSIASQDIPARYSLSKNNYWKVGTVGIVLSGRFSARLSCLQVLELNINFVFVDLDMTLRELLVLVNKIVYDTHH